MIEAKGVREKTASPTAARDRYVVKDSGHRARLPIAIGLFLVGLAAYVKSGFAAAEAAPADDHLEPTAIADEPAAFALEELLPAEITKALPPPPFELIDSPVFNYLDPNASPPPMPSADVLRFQRPAERGGGLNQTSSTVSGAVLPFPAPTPQTAAPGSAQAPDTGPSQATSGSDSSAAAPSGARPKEKQEEKNRAPRTNAPVVLTDVSGGTAILVSVSDLLRGTTDSDDDALVVGNIKASSGVLTQTDGGWIFQAEPGALGGVTLTYEISDGHVSVPQSAHFSLVPEIPIGTPAADALLGAVFADTVDGGAGDDTIDGGAGDDSIDGREGDDIIGAGSGNDNILAGDGHDVLVGGAHNDTILGGRGNDRLSGGDGDDMLSGDAGNDLIEGGSGDDSLFGGDGQDIVKGDSGRDVLRGGAGNDDMDGGADDDIVLAEAGDDIAEGGEGDDVMSDGTGTDILRGGAGNDLLLVGLDTDADSYEGGGGIDTLDVSESTAGVDVDLQSGIAEGAEIGSNSISSVECVIGGGGDDNLAGSAADEGFFGGAGADQLCGEAGSDVLHGGAGNDHLIGSLDAAEDTYDGGADYDTLDFSLATMRVEVDFASGSARGEEIGIDTIRDLEQVIGGQGDDLFVLGKSSMVMNGGAGADTFVFNGFVATSDVSEVVHEILDFMVGDRINIEQFELFDRKLGDDSFTQVYGDDGRSGEGPIRVRHDRLADLDRTIIEADLDRDDAYEISITLLGSHTLALLEHTS